MEGVLKNGFKLKYCNESLCLNSEHPVNLLIPMVSFCDIPLSQIQEHVGKYGNYGIGLSKKWAINNMVSPVQYVAIDSSYALSLREVFQNAQSQKSKWTDLTPIERHTHNLARYLKNYEADLERKGTVYQNYRFYDEREWRYVAKDDRDTPMYANLEKYKAHKEVYDKIIDNIRLKFEPTDIQYIIIESEEEIPNMIRHLKDIYTDDQDALDCLTTRIITQEQIKADF